MKWKLPIFSECQLLKQRWGMGGGREEEKRGRKGEREGGREGGRKEGRKERERKNGKKERKKERQAPVRSWDKGNERHIAPMMINSKP
jgi:hypothetical protein